MADRSSLDTVTAINRSIAEQLGGDHCFAVNHLMRLPGTINWPTAAKKRRGRVPVMSAIERPDSGAVYAPERLSRYFPPVAPRADRAEVDIGEVEPLGFADLALPKSDPLYATLMLPAGRDGSADALLAAGDLHRAGFSEAVIAGILMNEDVPAAAHVHRQSNPRRAVLRILQRVVGDAENDARSGGEAGAGSRSADRGAGAPGTAGGREAQPLALIDVGSLAGKPVAEQRWVVRKLVPDRQVTLFTAQGGGGKSYISLLLAGCVSIGERAFGFATTRGPALYLTCEDDDDENHRRLIGVANALNVGLDKFSGTLFVKSLVDRHDKGIAHLDQNTNKLRVEPLFHEVRATLLALRPKLVILDNVAHLFEGNENIRAHVAAFLGLLNALAIEADCAIILIGHPNKAGDSFSGSTAFQNQVRSHIHMEVDEADPDRRELRLAKANYARLEEPVRLLWHRGAFRLESSIPAGDSSASVRERTEDERFLACLDARNTQQRPVSPHTAARDSYAPKAFVGMREAQGMTEPHFKSALERLLSSGRIAHGELDYDRPGTRGHKAIGLHRTYRMEADDEPF
ncbi:MAG: AAA family ATPase [Sphingomonas pseudosanguinis]|uniref:AAA family ATPase n=1 Tax=Sphingomonas pseudosanguinis TaxID=413712 RepID=UPI0039194301